jgi:predicted dehydrogenase
MRKPTRRDAVKVMTVAPVIPVAQAAGKQVGCALIGCGARGQYLLEHLNRVAEARCIAVCDSHQPSAGKASSIASSKPAVARDHRAVLDRKDVEAVLLATPPHTHFPIVRDALEAGKHVFCETVLVFKPQEVEALRSLADSKDLVIQVGLARRYSKFYQTAKQMVSKGFLGEVTNIQTQWHRNPGPARDPKKSKEANWRFHRELSYGLLGDILAQQMDIGDWMFNDRPEFVTGVGSLDWRRDGRDTFDNVALIFRYPEGRQMVATAISTNRHLAMFGGQRNECGEIILGTEGTIEITLGSEKDPVLALWYYEPSGVKVGRPEEQMEIARAAGASVSARTRGYRAMPVLLERDQMTGDESFLDREMKYMRRWLYARGVMLPEEDTHPVAAQLAGFFDCVREANRPKAGVDAGLNNAQSVMFAQQALDGGQRVRFAGVASAG